MVGSSYIISSERSWKILECSRNRMCGIDDDVVSLWIASPLLHRRPLFFLVSLFSFGIPFDHRILFPFYSVVRDNDTYTLLLGNNINGLVYPDDHRVPGKRNNTRISYAKKLVVRNDLGVFRRRVIIRERCGFSWVDSHTRAFLVHS